MSDFIKIDGEDYVHLGSVKRLREITDAERQSLSELGEHVDASRFSTRIDYDDNSKSYVPETVEQLSRQAKLIDIGEGFVPAQNVKQARKLSQKDRASFEQRTGRELRADFVSRIKTSAGTVLSTAQPEAIMQQLGQPQRGNSPKQATPSQPGQKPAQKPVQSMTEQRDQVMQNAAPLPSSQSGKQPTTQPER